MIDHALDDRQRRSTPATAGTQHPTRALLDATPSAPASSRRGGFDGLRIAIVGDVKHSRVARSTIAGDATLGVHVTVVAPRRCCHRRRRAFADASPRLDDLIRDLDVLYLLRVQRERMNEALLPTS